MQPLERRIRIGETAQISSKELFEPKIDDPYIDLTFVCEGVPSGKRCGNVTMTLNLRTGHVFDETPGEEKAFFWIDAQGQDLLKVIFTLEGRKEVGDLIIQGHGILRHPTAQGAILEEKK